MISAALTYVALAVVTVALVIRTYGVGHASTTYRVGRLPPIVVHVDPIIRIGGYELRDSIDVAPHGGLTYASPFERWQQAQRAPEVLHESPPCLGFAPRSRVPANRHEKRRAKTLGGGR